MSQIFVKPIVGDDPLSVLRREVCTMGGCPEGAECFCAEIGRLNVQLDAAKKAISDLRAELDAMTTRGDRSLDRIKEITRQESDSDLDVIGKLSTENADLRATLKEACDEIKELRIYANNHGGMIEGGMEFKEGLRALSAAPLASAHGDEGMVERVARAICVARGFDPDDTSSGELQWTAYDQAARAAITAIGGK